jgi:hypothetical protein
MKFNVAKLCTLGGIVPRFEYEIGGQKLEKVENERDIGVGCPTKLVSIRNNRN